MSLQQQKVNVGELHVGMYVSDLDRPWLETPFKLQGFLIRNDEQIAELKSWCHHVFIDIEKGHSGFKPTQHHVLPGSARNEHTQPAPAIYSFTRYQKERNTYKLNNGFFKAVEVERVQIQVNETLHEVDAALEMGKVFDPRPVEQSAKDLVSSVLENPDVLAWLGRIEAFDCHSHEQAIRTAVWSCLFSRFLGLPQKDIEILVQASLLKDIGKTRLPKHIIEQSESELSGDEKKVYYKYVSLSVALLKQVKGLHSKVVDTIASHREHYNGSGFPRGLQGDEIPLLSIMLGIASFYDNLVNPRLLADSIAPSEVMRNLHRMKNRQFQEDLVSDFIQSQGMFPPGSIVELNTGALAVVVEQSFAHQMRPKIAIVTDSSRKPLNRIKMLDLFSEAVIEPAAGRLPHLNIVRDLSAADCEFDLLRVKRAIFKPNKSRLSFFKR